jgi:rhamnosyltransferase
MMPRRVIAIVTAFCPSASLISNVRSLLSQVDAVVVVDDGSGETYDLIFGSVADSGATVVRIAINSGIAAALNTGISAAGASQDDLLVTFDQDSAVPAGFVLALTSRWDAATASGARVGLVAPATFAGEPQVMRTDGEVAREPIQSGSLYSAAVLNDVGPFREELFIDLVDVEYYLRLREMGYETLAVPDLDLPHELGRSYPITVFGIPIRLRGRLLTTSLSTPFRYYYRARNRVIIDAEYGRSQAALLRRDHRMELRHLIFVLGYARPRRAMLALLRDGRRAGRSRTLGRMPEDAMRSARAVRWRPDPVDRAAT